MPLTIKKQGSKYVVTDPAGKKFGTHDTKKEAIDQIAAIEMSKKRRGKSMTNEIELGRGVKLVANDRLGDLNIVPKQDAEAEVKAPPIAIISDGTPGGTVLMVHGQVVPFSSMDLYCSNGEYASCSMSITTREKDANGLEVSRTMTLRKYEEPADLD